MSVKLTALFNPQGSNALNAQSNHGARSSESIQQISSGSVLGTKDSNPAAQAIVSGLRVLSSILNIAKESTVKTQAVCQLAASAVDNDIALIQSMKELATISSGGDVDANKRLLLDTTYQQLKAQINSNASSVKWGTSALLSGGGGALSYGGAQTQGATGLTAVSNAFATTLAASSAGFISGTASSATVTANNGGGYDVSIVVGKQTFEAKGVTPVGSAVLTLVSTGDSANHIDLTFDSAVTAITDAATFKTSLDTLLGLGAGAQRAQFLSASAAAIGQNGVTGVSINGNTDARTYALSYVAGTGDMHLTSDTGQCWDAKVTADGAQSIHFANGVSVDVGAGFALATAITTSVFEVSAGTGVTLSVQVGENSVSDVLTQAMPVATTSALGLSSTDILTLSGAQSAGLALDDALLTLQQASSSISAFETRLQKSSEILEATIGNVNSSTSVYNDTDLAKATLNVIQSMSAEKAAYRGITDSLSRLRELVNLVQNAQ